MLFRSGRAAPEVMVASFVEADRPLAEPTGLRSVTLRVLPREGSIEAPL